jgi:hypothetical protein
MKLVDVVEKLKQGAPKGLEKELLAIVFADLVATPDDARHESGRWSY